MSKIYLLSFLLLQILFCNAQTIPNTLRFNSATTTENFPDRQTETDPTEICADFYFDQLKLNYVYSKSCDGNPIYKIKILQLNSNKVYSENNYSFDYIGYDLNRKVEYNSKGGILPNRSILLSYYYGKFTLLVADVIYDPSTLELFGGSGIKFFNTENRIQK